jgi:hypothetical protein
MSLSKDLHCHPALIGERIHLISDETTDTANRKDLIVSSNPRALFVHRSRSLPTSQTKPSNGVMSPAWDQ